MTTKLKPFAICVLSLSLSISAFAKPPVATTLPEKAPGAEAKKVTKPATPPKVTAEKKAPPVKTTKTAKKAKPVGKQRISKPINMPGIMIDVVKHRMEIDATVCLESGILEWLLVGNDTKEHESIFATKVKPSQVKLGLILIGTTKGPYPVGAEKWKDFQTRDNFKNTCVNISAQWTLNGKTETHAVRELMLNRKTEKTPLQLPWVFTGSSEIKKDGKKQFLGDFIRLIISVWPDSDAVVQLGVDGQNPYHGDGMGFEANAKALPPVGTAVKLIFEPVKFAK